MGAPYHHAELSAKRFGGIPEDYMPIHELMDSSKQAFSDLRHRTLTHHPWFVNTIVERIFGPTITNTDGKKIAVRDIAQWHVMEDFGGSYPSVQDYLVNIKFAQWMDNGKDGAVPPSHEGLPPIDPSLFTPGKKQRTPPSLPKNEDFPPFKFEEEVSGRGCGGAGRVD